MRAVIAEDQVLLREGLARLFADGGHEVVATVGDGEALVEAVDREIPDLAVVDIRMPPTYTDEGARAAGAIKRKHPGVGVLVLSSTSRQRMQSTLSGSRASAICSRTEYSRLTSSL